jgi:dTDP-4-amino-4,6-dideoxygalactose transaminase
VTRSIARKVPLLDLQHQNEVLAEEIGAALQRVVRSQRFILGEDVALFEREVAEYLKAPYAIGCASGSDALFLALLAAGIGPGDAVATTAFSFFATAGAVVRAGARPVLVDIDPETFNLNPVELEAAAACFSNIRAVIPVHLYGGAADMQPILDLARSRGWCVIEDAAQSIGAEYAGERVGTLGDIGCFSFFPSKNLGAFGDAGLLTARDANVARRLAALRVHGSQEKYLHEWVGINSRIDTLQCAVLRVKLRYLDEWTAGRQENAAAYSARLSGLPVQTPVVAPYQTRHVFNQYVIRAPRRDELREFLAGRGIGTEVYYPIPFHLQPCFQNLGYPRGAFPESERAAEEVVALPIHSGLTADDLDFVCDAIHAFYDGQGL